MTSLKQLATVIAAVSFFGMAFTPARSAIIHKYTFNDGNAADGVGSADGILMNTNGVFSVGRLDLSGNTGEGSNGLVNDSYVDLPNGIISGAASSGTSGALSLEMWARSSTNRNWAALFSGGSSDGGEDTSPGGAASDYLQLIPQNGQNQTIRTTSHTANVGAEGFVDFSAPLSTGADQHIVAVFDQSGGIPGTVQLYVDGAFIGTNPISDGLDITTFANNPGGDDNNWLGRSQWNDAAFDGSYEEFRIHDEALTAQQVADSHNEGPDLGDVLTLTVNTTNGSVMLDNPSDTEATTFTYYQIDSTAGALDPAGWNSLSDQNLDPVGGGDDPGETWDESPGSSSNLLAELFLQGSSTLGASAAFSLGNAFDTSVFGRNQDGDLTFSFANMGGPLQTGRVAYESSGITGDFDGNGVYECADVDALVGEIAAGTNDAAFDLTGDGLVDIDDLDSWRAEAGAAQLASGNPYLEGDANLDGSVDVSDFNNWNGNKFTATAAWCSGDFNADGSVDVSDFNIWNSSKFQSADGVSAVPEPATAALAMWTWLAFVWVVRRRGG